MEHYPQLAAACFAIGVAALLWVYRRTLLRARLPVNELDLGSYRTRFFAAGMEIDEISAREWLATWRNALKFQRGATRLSADERTALARLSVWQQTHRRSKEA